MTSVLTPKKEPRSLAPSPARPAPMLDEISRRTVVVLAVSWIVLNAIGVALEPELPADVAVPGYVVALAWAWLTLAVATGAGLMLRMRFALPASLGGAIVFVAASIACPVSGHHPIGMWWIGQLFCALALVGVSVWALVREHGPADASADTA